MYQIFFTVNETVKVIIRFDYVSIFQLSTTDVKRHLVYIKLYFHVDYGAFNSTDHANVLQTN